MLSQLAAISLGHVAPKKAPDKDARRTLYARVPEPVYSKLQKLAARRSAKLGARVTLQDVVIELIQEAT